MPSFGLFLLFFLRYNTTTTLHMLHTLHTLDNGRRDGEGVDLLHTRHPPQIGANAEKKEKKQTNMEKPSLRIIPRNQHVYMSQKN